MSIIAKRIISGIIDHAISCYVSVALVLLVTQGTGEVSPMSIKVFLCAYFLTMLFKDIVFKNASAGKKIMRLKIVKDNFDSVPFSMNIKHCLKRGLPLILLLPIEIALLVLNKRRIGDYWAKTNVVLK